MRTHLVVAMAGCLAACGVPNPRDCSDGTCSDPAYPFCDVDAMFQDTANTCIAVSCTPSEFTACRGSSALVCNSAGTDYDIVSCPNECSDAAGGCVGCISNSDCAGTTPRCDLTAHECVACSQDDDCDSRVCDVSMGSCVDPTVVLYAAPDGAAANECTLAIPCSLSRAAANLSAARSVIRMLPGEYASSIAVSATQQGSVHGGGATIDGSISVTQGGALHVRDLTVKGAGTNCSSSLSASTLGSIT